MKTATEVFRTITKEAETNRNDPRFYRVHTIGHELRQGDVYLYPVESVPSGAKEIEQRQLAPGATKGSRHVVEGGVRVFANPSTDALAGPFVEVVERATLTHPEHAHISLAPGVYECRYQRDYAAEERRRVAD